MEIFLDSSILMWIFIPILLMCGFLSHIRTKIQTMLSSKPPAVKIKNENSLKSSLEDARLGRVKMLQLNGGLLPFSSFNRKKTYLANQMLEYVAPAQDEDPMAALQNNPMANPSNMMNMMKGQMLTPIIFSAQFYLIQFFFSGLIVAKLNFPLTQTFRNMLQKEIRVQSLDVKYVSGLSLYFISFIALHKLLSLIRKPNLVKPAGHKDPLVDKFEKKNVEKMVKAMNQMGMNRMGPMSSPMPTMPSLGGAPGGQKAKKFEEHQRNARFMDHLFYLKASDTLLSEKWESEDCE